MSFRKMQSMSRWKLNVIALFFLFDTLTRAVWRRRGKGMRGLVRYPWLLFKYVTKVLIGLLLITWRARIILSAYAWFRRIDDVMDEDGKTPREYTRESYIAQKREIMGSLPSIDDCTVPFLTEDLLLVHLLRESKHYGVDVTKEIMNLWSVMCWENERRSRRTLPAREEMIHYATLQDDSILGVCVKIFNGTVQRFFREVSCLLAGTLTRTDWLSDLDHDLQKGIVNIPREALSDRNPDLSRLFERKSWREIRAIPGLPYWYVKEAKTLNEKWADARASLSRNFGGPFLSRFLIFVFQKLMADEFECDLEGSYPQALT